MFCLGNNKNGFMIFSRGDLMLDHYNWEEQSNLYVGNPTRRLFNRLNGHQVLFLINCCNAFMDSFTVHEGRDIEQRIRKLLPEDVKSEVSVFRWLRAAFYDEWMAAINKSGSSNGLHL